MIRVNLDTGQTVTLDLEDKAHRERWAVLRADPAFQAQVSGVAVVRDKIVHALPLPRKFRHIVYDAELIHDPKRRQTAAERVTCYADQVQISLTVYVDGANGAPPLARVDVTRLGRLRHSPLLSPLHAGDAEGEPTGDAPG